MFCCIHIWVYFVYWFLSQIVLPLACMSHSIVSFVPLIRSFLPPPQSAFYIHRLNIYMHICKFKFRFCIWENLWTGLLSEFGLFCLLHILISDSIYFSDDIILYNWVKFHSLNASCCLHVHVDRPMGSLYIAAIVNQGSSKCGCVSISVVFCLRIPGYISRSGVGGSYYNFNFGCLGTSIMAIPVYTLASSE